jgi:glycosyltransferase involved in cell wall biosynthesis
MDYRSHNPRIALLIPCYNEAITIAEVIRQFRQELPAADIYVYDNNSTDQTAEIARREGAIVRFERRQGKGYVVQSMFRQIEADIYIMVDGDGTYQPEDIHALLEPVLQNRADMVVGSRLTESQSEFKTLNRFGNRMFLNFLNKMFKVKLTDILSGYRVFNRRFVKGIPLFGGGFEIETELTIKALERGFVTVEIPTRLTQRPEGSFSKIRLFRDGFLILNTILTLFRDYKLLWRYGSASDVYWIHPRRDCNH